MILQYRLLGLSLKDTRYIKLFFFCFQTGDTFCQKVMMGSNYKENLSRILHGIVYS